MAERFGFQPERSASQPATTPNPSSEEEGLSFCGRAAQLCGQCAFLLGWRPAEFWETTPAELACVLGAFAPQNEVPPDAAELNQLMELFPDG